MGNKEEQAAHERCVLQIAKHFVDTADIRSFYGFSQSDIEALKESFRDLDQNSETKFPDFSNSHACVELFAVSSSECIRHGGPTQMMQDGKLRDQIKRDDSVAMEEGNQSVRSYARIHPNHSYNNFCKSFRKGFDKHLKSLQEAERDFATVVFVVEYPECDLECAFMPDVDINCDGLTMGDLAPVYADGKTHGLYRLSRDRENLLWLANNASAVDYVVFIGVGRAEAINIHEAGTVAAFLPWRLLAIGNISITLAESSFMPCIVGGPSNE